MNLTIVVKGCIEMDKERERSIDKPSELEESEQKPLEEMGCKVLEVTKGYLNKIVKVEHEGKNCFAKIFKRRDRFENESQWLERTSPLPFTPDLLGLHEGNDEVKPIILMSAVPGQFLRDVPSASMDIDKIIRSIVRRMDEIDQAVKDQAPPIDQWIGERRALLEHWVQTTMAAERCAPEIKKIVGAASSEYKEGESLIQKVESACFVHSDINARNITVDDTNEIQGIIDFEYATYGDRIYDAVRIIWRLLDNRNSAIAELREAGFAKFDEEERERLRLYKIFNYIASISFYFVRGGDERGYPFPEGSVQGLSEEIIRNM